MDKKFLSAEEAVSQFGLDLAALQQLVDAGDLRALADRGSWKYRREELEQLIQSGRLPARHPAGDGASESSTTQDFAFLEIDENALEDGATTITSGAPAEITGPDTGFSSDAEIMMIDSDPEVEVIQPGSSSSTEIPIASSLTELGIVIQDEPKSEPGTVTDESSIIIADASDSSMLSTSDVKVDSDSDVKVASDSDVKVVKDSATSGDMAVTGGEHSVLGDSSVITPTDGSSIVSSDSDVRLADSGIALEHGVPDSGITLDSDSGITLQSDSGLTLDSAQDSGLTLEPSSDSGLTLEAAADSGISLEGSADSGISLEASDSGLSLTDAESGIRLSGAAPAPRAALPDDTLPEFDQIGSSGDHTAMVESFEGSSDDMATVPPPKAKTGKPAKRPGLTDNFTMDDEVQDLEIVEDLEAGDVDVDSLADEEPEDILEASDEAFSLAESGMVSEESSVASVPVMKSVAKEPPWGVVTLIPLAACAVLLLVQGLLLWDGINTMWSGETSKALGAAVIDSLSGIGG